MKSLNKLFLLSFTITLIYGCNPLYDNEVSSSFFGGGGLPSFFTQYGVTTTFPGGSNTGDDFCEAVATDQHGYMYCAGYSNGNIGEISAGGPNDAFVMKLDNLGAIVWMTHLGGTTVVSGGTNSSEDRFTGVVVDDDGNVHLSGYTTGDMSETNGGSALPDAFVMKLDSDGNILWYRQLGQVTIGVNAGGTDKCYGIDIDDSGNVYCAGTTDGSLGETNSGGTDIFALKLDSSGSVVWLTQLGASTGAGNRSSNDVCSDVSVDSSGNVYCVGNTQGSVGENNNGSNDILVNKFDSSGNFLWSTQLGDTTYAPGGSDHTSSDNCLASALDSYDNIYCAGTTLGSVGEPNGGNGDAFVLKLDSSGAVVWATQLGANTIVSAGFNNSGSEYCYDLSISTLDKIYCGGSTSGSLADVCSGGSDVMILKFTINGVLDWGFQMGSNNVAQGADNSGTDICKGISTDRNGNVICGGKTDGSMGEAVSAASEDMFIFRLEDDGDFTP